MSDEDRIRATYAGYDEQGRSHLWDRSNPGYARLADGRDVAVNTLVAQSLSASPARFLDVGCGDGSLVGTVTSRWPDVDGVGLDLLPDRVERARAAFPEATFVAGSADALPFDDASFDGVSAITLFSSFPSPELEVAVAAEIKRVLRPGGWLVWYDLRYDNPSNPAVHGLSKGRLRELFPGWEQRLSTLTLLPPVARRLGVLTPVVYPLLHAVPPLRSHLIGRLRHP
jgi:ubiquinone/menaquinone biosynthesis C-methylase UbiE